MASIFRWFRRKTYQFMPTWISCLHVVPKQLSEDLKTPWTGSMVLRKTGSGERVNYPGCSHSTVKMEWISKETCENGQPVSVRLPRETTRVCSPNQIFRVLNRGYWNAGRLVAEMDKTYHWCRDTSGREVLYISERFPCFDSYDYASEHRRYHWFFIREGCKLGRIQYTDESGELYVTQDVENLETHCWEIMQKIGYFDG